MRGIGFRLALARPDIRYEMKIRGRRVFLLAGFRPPVDAVTAVYGKQLAKEMLPVSSAEPGISLTGLTGKPSLSRSSRSHITITINGRYVRCPVITAAIEEAYRFLLPQGRRPVTVLALTVDPELLDVNVHPAKLEVKLLEEKKVADLVTLALREALRVKEIIPATKVSRPFLESKEHKESGLQLTINPQQDQRVPPGSRKWFSERSRQNTKLQAPAYPEAADRSKEPCLGRQNQLKKRPSFAQENELPVLNARLTCLRLYSGCRREGLYIVDQHAAQRGSFMRAT